MTDHRSLPRLLGILAAALLLAASTTPKAKEVPVGESAGGDEPVIAALEVKFLGSKLHLLAAGDPQAPPVLLLHGGRFSSETWRELGTIELLARQGYRVLALDLPGFGASEASETPAGHFLASLLPLLAERPVVVVSPSMSGRFSLPLVVRRPDYVAGFVPIAPVAISNHLDKLKGSKMPTLLVWGENDTTIPLREAEALAKVLVNDRLVVLEGASHPCYLDRPFEFHRELLQFLAGLPK